MEPSAVIGKTDDDLYHPELAAVLLQDDRQVLETGQPMRRKIELLRDTPLNMTEIALECGYESPAAFSRAFRRATNQSPSAFRATARR